MVVSLARYQNRANDWRGTLAGRRVLLLGASSLPRDLVKGIIDRTEGVEIVAELTAEDGLAVALEESRADFVITWSDRPVMREPYTSLLERWPLVRVLALEEDGQQATLWELRPRRVSLGELSPRTLLDALRSPGWRNGVDAN